MRISDWSSDVCSSDLIADVEPVRVCLSCQTQTGSTSAICHRDGAHEYGHWCVRTRLAGTGRPFVRLNRRSDARRVREECVSRRSSRRSPVHYITNHHSNHPPPSFVHLTIRSQL